MTQKLECLYRVHPFDNKSGPSNPSLFLIRMFISDISNIQLDFARK